MCIVLRHEGFVTIDFLSIVIIMKLFQSIFMKRLLHTQLQLLELYGYDFNSDQILAV